jgi:hypothetical protein
MRRAIWSRSVVMLAVLGGILGLGQTTNVTATVGGSWTLTVRTLLCPEDYADETYAEDCTVPFPGVAFSTALTSVPESRISFATGDDGSVTVDLNGPADERMVAPTLPEGIASLAVFCTGNVGEAFDYRLTGGRLWVEGVGQDDAVSCDWYVVPWKPRDASLIVTVSACPPGMTMETLAPDRCTPITEGFDFSLGSTTDLMGQLTRRDATFDGTSYTWDLPPAPPPGVRFDEGNFNIREFELPAGFTSYAATGDAIRAVEGPDYAFEVSYLEPVASLDFYNFAPDPADAVTVVADAVSCASADADPAGCESLEGVAIGVQADGFEIGGSPFVTSPNSIGFNVAAFTVPSGAMLTLSVVGGLPAGVGPAPDFAPLVVAVADLDVAACGAESLCPTAYIVNVPGGVPTGRTLTIAKFTCPAGYAGDAYAADCTEPGEGVPFWYGTPRSEAVSLPRDTDADGGVTFYFNPNVPLDGQLTIVERPPATTERLAVFCTDDAGNDLAVSSEGSTGFVEVNVGEQGNVSCEWYNVPTAGGGE